MIRGVLGDFGQRQIVQVYIDREMFDEKASFAASTDGCFVVKNKARPIKNVHTVRYNIDRGPRLGQGRKEVVMVSRQWKEKKRGLKTNWY
jgi:hypothetical protein